MEKALVKLGKKIKDKIGENTFNIIKAIFSEIPGGSAFTSLINDYIPSKKHERLIKFTKQLAEDLKNLKGEVKEGYVSTEEFAYLFEQTYRAVAENYQKEKLDMFRGLLINSIKKDMPYITPEEKEFFLNLLKRLEVLHIKLLKFFYNPQKYIIDIGSNPSLVKEFSFGDTINFYMQEVSIDSIKLAHEELYRYGLLNTDKSIYNTMTAGRGLQIVQGRISDFGKRFVEFCVP